MHRQILDILCSENRQSRGIRVETSVDFRVRLRDTLEHREPRRIPAAGSFRPEIWDRLEAHFDTTDHDRVLDRFGIGVRGAGLEPSNAFREVATPLSEHLRASEVGVGRGRWVRMTSDGYYEDDWGVVRRLRSDGAYFHFVRHPLAAAGNPDEYRFPDPDLPEIYDDVRNTVERYRDRYFVSAGMSYPFRQAWNLRGYEQFMVDLYHHRGFAEKLLDRLTEVWTAIVVHFVEIGVDIVTMGGDVATQRGMMVDPEVWRRYCKPRLMRIIEEARRHGEVFFCFHSDGDFTPIVGDLIEIGWDIIDPVQPECMDPAFVKREYGAEVVIEKTISSQRTMPFGTPEDVRAEVKNRIDDCGAGGGLILGPSNTVQFDVPVENIIACYEAIDEYGRK